MKKTQTTLPEIKLVGLTVRTNNKNESDWMKGKIFPCVKEYFSQQYFEKIPHRKKPGTTLCVYTEYESDHNGDYTYFIGEEVATFDGIPEGFVTHTIPSQTYAKFTTEPGSMPTVLSQAWANIWNMTPEILGGKRRYHSDFEVYDERASDPSHQNIVIDLYIGTE